MPMIGSAARGDSARADAGTIVVYADAGADLGAGRSRNGIDAAQARAKALGGTLGVTIVDLTTGASAI